MKLEISIKDVQRIKKIDFSANLAEKSIICITGRNGSGKTTLIKSIRNLVSADTFQTTSSARTFESSSTIHYKIDDKDIVFKYDKQKKILDTKDSIPNSLRKQLFIELPIPHGERFNFFQKISAIDADLRTSLVLNKQTRPIELIEFLSEIYATNKFEHLIEVRIRNTPYYATILDNGYYLREDYFSSGEYFLISLYRRIASGHMAIFVDEIDISLDAAAQVRLVKWLRKFKDKYNTTFVFTTHSLAMMRTLEPDELFYMEERDDGSMAIEKRSYAFIKSTLFGFKGWDRYILTEDDVLRDFVTHLIQKYCRPTFYQYKIIYVGGGTNTTDLMKRNETEKFFAENPESVIAVLDGDQRNKPHSRKGNIHCIPMESVEKELLTRCLSREFWDFEKLQKVIDDCDRLSDFINGQKKNKKNRLKALLLKLFLIMKKTPALRRQLSIAKGEPAREKDFNTAGKNLYKHLIKSKEKTKQQIFDFLINKNHTEIEKFRHKIEEFICLEPQDIQKHTKELDRKENS